MVQWYVDDTQLYVPVKTFNPSLTSYLFYKLDVPQHPLFKLQQTRGPPVGPLQAQLPYTRESVLFLS